MTWGMCATKISLFFIGKTCNIDDYEMANAFKMLDQLLTNISYTTIKTQKPKGKWNLICSAGE